MKSLLVFLILFYALPVFAYDVVEPVFTEQYAPASVTSDFYTKTNYLGTLGGDAQLYEITVPVGDVLPITLQQRANRTPVPFGLLVVEVLGDGEGVREVARQNVPPEEWTRVKDARLGLTLLQSPTLEVALTPGTYQIEVSTPDNIGPYALSLGVDDLSPGYFATIGAVRKTQAHFGYSIFRLLISSYVYWPLGIVMFLYAFYKLYRVSIKL